MRQNNQNKRLRGRSRKGPNPLTRSFESNGPDVKIRGTAMHIAEKYQQLARDAHVSGDRIMAENYLQHAEHYSRIVAAAQAQNGAPMQQSRSVNEPDDDDQEEQAAESAAPAPVAAKARVMPEDAPQPFLDRMPGVDAKNGGTNGANGTGEQAPRREAASGDSGSEGEEEGGDEPTRPRRRARGTRGRNVRRAAASKGDGEGAPSEAPAEASEA